MHRWHLCFGSGTSLETKILFDCLTSGHTSGLPLALLFDCRIAIPLPYVFDRYAQHISSNILCPTDRDVSVCSRLWAHNSIIRITTRGTKLSAYFWVERATWLFVLICDARFSHFLLLACKSVPWGFAYRMRKTGIMHSRNGIIYEGIPCCPHVFIIIVPGICTSWFVILCFFISGHSSLFYGVGRYMIKSQRPLPQITMLATLAACIQFTRLGSWNSSI